VVQTGGLRGSRLASLDAFRGLAIAGMILVNNPGTWTDVYWPLQHAAGNGCTFADLIFPFFLFIVGAAVTFSVGQQARRDMARRRLLVRVFRRALLIFALGIFLNGFPLFDWSTLRIPGVLQRIAVCYTVTALIVVTLPLRGQAFTAALLLVGYAAAMRLVPLITGVDDFAAAIDRWLLGAHLLRPESDPEGILSTLPAIATTLMGALAGHCLQAPSTRLRRVATLLGAGTGAIGAGLAAALWLPLNKSAWTPPFALLTAGVALLVLATCYWLIDCLGYRRWATPLAVYGTNPIVAYVLSSLMAKTLLLWQVAQADGTRMSLQEYVFAHLFLPLARPINASLLYAVSYVLVWFVISAVLYRNRVLIKI